ncbi:doublecortin domain-containing protein 2C isoform X2 [Paroedura picta]|uniref:doublecortin domain-containing protein 2C isoform X2 n=1 Tax=Paroedura picta TaxID=143630 RepID=UPI004057A8C3
MVAASRSRAAYSLTDVTPARTIWVYRNGDPYFPGRRFVVNHRYMPTFEAFMIQLNEGLPTPFGVRSVYTPREGHSVNDLTDLYSGGKYVAAGREKFKKLNYFRIGAKKPQRRKKEEVIRPVVHSNIQVPSKWQSFYNKPLILKFTLTKWDRVLTLINEKVLLRSGGIHRLHTLHGQLVHGPEELEDNQFYVACGNEKFQSLPYQQHPKVPDNVRRNLREGTPESPKPPKRKTEPMQGTHFCKQSEDSMFKSIYKSPQLQTAESPKRPDTYTSRSKASPCHSPVQSPKEKPKKEEGNRQSAYYARSKKASPERAPKELSSDDGHSVFKAVEKQKETEEAKEIPEDKDVKVDVPVDQAPAETVQEEDIYDNAEYLAEKPKDDGDYEEQNLQTKKSLSQRVFEFLHKKKGSKSESSSSKDSFNKSGKESEGRTEHEDSDSMQQLHPRQKMSENAQRNSQNDIKEEKKEKTTKRNQSHFIKQREYFDEDDYY